MVDKYNDENGKKYFKDERDLQPKWRGQKTKYSQMILT